MAGRMRTGTFLNVCRTCGRWSRKPGNGSGAAGSTGQVQFNNAGAFAADSNFFWDNTNKRLGIGTSAPTVPLSVYASSPSGGDIMRIQSSSASTNLASDYSFLGLYNSNTTNNNYSSIYFLGLKTGDTNPTYLAGIQGVMPDHTQYNGELRFITEAGGVNVERVRISSGGNVGIGTASPTSPLHVSPGAVDVVGLFEGTGGVQARIAVNAINTSADSEITFKNAGTGRWSIGNAGAGNVDSLVFSAATDGLTNPVVTILQSGNVGIGTTSPGVELDVVGPAGGGVGIRTSNSGDQGINIASTNGYLPYLAFQKTGASKWLLGVERDTPFYGAASNDLICYDYAGTAGTRMVIKSSTGNVGIGTTVPAYLLHVGSASASGIVLELQNSSGACTFQPSSSSLQTVCSSDRRLKDDIVDATPALPQLADMRVRNYTIKASGERTIGVIAQEMIWKHADMVHMGAEGMYGVEAPNIWLLVKAIQELKDTNDDLAARLSADDDALKAATDNITELRAVFDAYRDAHP
jgi:endosialidase-like protein